MKHWKFVLLSAVLIGVFSFAFNNCGNAIRIERVQDTISGNPIVAMKALAYTSAITNLRVCIDRYEFVLGDSFYSVPGDTTIRDLSPQSSTSLFSGSVPAGHYTSVRLHIRDNCGTGSSLSFSNSGGQIDVVGDAIMHFNGEFDVEGTGTNLNLQFQPFTEAFEGAANADQAQNIADTYDGAIVP